MKFKAPIEVQAGISDGDPTNPLGVAGYLLSSDGSNVSWVSPGGLSAETAEAIVQPIKANEALTKGDPLYIVGYQTGQDVNIVARADSSNSAKMPVVGIADADYSSQAFGTMTAFGSFNGNFDTTGGTENWSIGDIIFVKSGGGLTNVKPVGTDLIQNIAIVSRVQQNTGELEVIALGRTNDVPNLPTGRLFVGTATNTSKTSDVVYVDDTNDRVGIRTTGTPSTNLEVSSSSNLNGIDISESGTNPTQSGGLFFTTNTPSEGFLFRNTNGTFQINSGGIPNSASGNSRITITGSSGNVGIGVTGASAKLHVRETLNPTSAGFLLQVESVNSGGNYFNTSGFYRDSSQNMRLYLTPNNVQPSVKIDSSGDSFFNGGDVGIGISLPSQKLHVQGNARLTGLFYDGSNSGGTSGQILSSDGGQTEWIDGSAIPGVPAGSGTTNYLARWTPNADTLGIGATYDDGTNVGIGTTSPGYTLEVHSGNGLFVGDGGVPVLEANPQNGNFKIGDVDELGDGVYATNTGTSNFDIYSTGSIKFRMDVNGHVGIGTTSPQAKLQINSSGLGQNINDTTTQAIFNSANSNASSLYIQDYRTAAGNDWTYSGKRIQEKIDSSWMGYMQFNGDGNHGGVSFGTGISTTQSSVDERMRINSAGNVGIGTTSPSELLHLKSTGPARILIEADTDNVTETDNAQIILKQDGGAVVGNLGFKTGTNGIEITNQYVGADGILTFGTRGVERMRISDLGNVGIGTTNPDVELEVSSPSGGVLRLTSSDTSVATGESIGRVEFKSNDVSTGGNNTMGFVDCLATNLGSTYALAFGTGNAAAATERMRINQVGNVGIGTTSPGSKLQVNGEIDANGGDGYRIEGKPWADFNLGTDILKLGDWDAEGFSTSIFDESSLEVFKVKDQGVIINCDRTSSTAFGADASLVVGGSKFSSWGPGVVTLLNNDPSSLASDSTGLIQFAIKDDATSDAGYTSAVIKGSIGAAAGSGSSGGGILDFLTSTGGTGSSPATRMRINELGDVGIGVTGIRAKLHVNGGIKLGNDTGSASAAKSGTFRYYTSGNNSYVDMCMQTGASTYAWVNVVTNSW